MCVTLHCGGHLRQVSAHSGIQTADSTIKHEQALIHSVTFLSDAVADKRDMWHSLCSHWQKLALPATAIAQIPTVYPQSQQAFVKDSFLSEAVTQHNSRCGNQHRAVAEHGCPTLPSPRPLMTFPRVSRLLLMALPSVCLSLLSPSSLAASVLRSLPAKSTKFSVETCASIHGVSAESA